VVIHVGSEYDEDVYTPLVTVPAFPVVFWFKVGISEATIALNVGAPALPLGAARK
jgi:hypothetical protein